jgi:hypothetical protein
MSVTFSAGIEKHKMIGDQIVIGFDELAGSPRLNFSNTNARQLLWTIGVEEEDLCGALTDLPFLKRKLVRAINSKSARADGIRSPLKEGNFFDMGQSEEAVVQKLKGLLELADIAQKNNAVISYG